MQTRVDFRARKIAGEKYFARWNDFRAQGHRIEVISRVDHPVEWEKWKRYYRSHGLWTLLDLMGEGRSEKSVPCLDPDDFDATVFVEVGPDRRVKDD